MGTNERDRWSKAEILFKLISAILIPIAIVTLGLIGNHYLQKTQESAEKFQLYSELMSKREESESAVRKDMFNSIIGSFLDKTKKKPEEEVLNLELEE